VPILTPSWLELPESTDGTRCGSVLTQHHVDTTGRCGKEWGSLGQASPKVHFGFDPCRSNQRLRPLASIPPASKASVSRNGQDSPLSPVSHGNETWLDHNDLLAELVNTDALRHDVAAFSGHSSPRGGRT
jgi:hypothetical protein